MNLLILDSKSSAIENVRSMLNLAELGISRCYGVCSVSEARTLIADNRIDILLAAVEMSGAEPAGKAPGLELLAWIRERKLDIACIFMADRPDFSCARQAIALGCQGYLLRPLDGEELRTTLEKTISGRREYEKLRIKSDFYAANEKRITRDFWKDLFYENISADRQSIEHQLKHRSLIIQPDWLYGVVLLMVRTWREDQYDRLDRFVINNVAQELFEMTVAEAVDWQDVMQFGERAQIAVCGARSGEGIFELCRRFAEQYTRMIRQYADVRIIGYVGRVVPIETVAEEIENLLLMDSQHLEDHGVVLYSEAGNLLRLDRGADDRFSRWEQLLCGGKITKVRQELFDYLDHLDVSGGLNKRSFYYFYTRYLEILSRYAQEHQIVMSRLTEEESHRKCFEDAMRNIQSMKAWIDCSLRQFEELAERDEMDLDPVEATVKYIREHMAEPLEMAELAANVHFNQDYLTRIFKRKMNTSVKNYIVTCRMERSRELLESTDLPIAEVAYQVGYYNYTSFNRAFKKQFDESPQAFRQRVE